MGQTSKIQRVLICEDEGITAMSLHKALIQGGYVVVAEEADGQRAVALTRQLQPDLVIMDIGLAGPLSGLDAAREILRTQSAPILIVTAYSDEDHREAALQMGVCGYLIKPVMSTQLLPAVAEALARDRERHDPAQTANTISETASADW